MGVSQSVAARTGRVNLLDLDSYKHLVWRLSDGSGQCSKYVKMIKERAEIEIKYAVNLRDWSEKWEKIIAKGPESGTVKEAWQSHVKEARDVARFHDNCSQRIREEVIPHVKKWKHEHYHKGRFRFGCKEINEAKRGFCIAQRPWKRKSKKVNSFKKAYHKACKVYDRQRQAVAAEDNVNFDEENDEQLIKYRVKMRKAESDYRTSIREILMPRYKNQYKHNMYIEFRKCQEAEESRLNNLQETIRKYREVVDLTMNQR